ncbi:MULTISPECIES: AraC family transcriptional regulator [Rhizobium/Agrobacterium group]|uniref:Transcriptional regulatory protein n=2 Tax=Rhizobium/Agrobacterium group TaxID=227290 RepID=B9K5W8_ALLAM|nr:MULTISPECIES: AraC family transcriptional regulator [Rhizobium/Agrobacterium group]ACM40266.1 transcriptional regulatory protein [Allorhizobium ampelinum S4]MCF1495008.1 AraC family transcriptional regulator [Allorhizobium ampelinum]MUO31657.1 helix-turn-helix domain-containing protein [Agrobacterium vitis]MUO45504.1 helix-turn-helix domain-containing protein [Agrobacterium vitis]MUP13303.1 helix-turn-helix domain-containing protein [Agrobacterium vitis]
MTQARTPSGFALAIVLAYQKRGMTEQPALLAAGIDPATLHADGRITADQLERLSDHAMRELDDEALGWFSHRLPWGSYGMLCRASLPSATLGIAITRWCRHHNLITQDVTLSLETRRNLAEVRIEEKSELGAFREFCLVSLLRNLQGVASWLGDTRIPLVDVAFPFDAPAHAESYRYLFNGPASFGADQASLRFDAAYLGLPVLRDDAALRQMLRRPLPLMVRQYRRDRLLSREILRLLNDMPAAGIDDLAEKLNLSTRSLHRHIKQEGTSFQALKDLSRQRLAERLLASTQWPIKRIARECGFDAEASFVRAFKSWTGQTPRAFAVAARQGTSSHKS